MRKIRTLVVDDEPLARERIRALLAEEADIEVVGEARDGEEAVKAILAHEPDLVFLDIQMPRMDGFEVIRTVGPDNMPLVVFVTAYDQHALKAFDVRALDYLLKPFDRERFAESIGRVRDAIEHAGGDELGRRLLELLRELKPGTRIVSHAFRMGDWEPERTQDVDGRMIYFWTVPKQNPS